IREVERDALFVINEQVPEIAKRHLLFMINEASLNNDEIERYRDLIDELIKNGYLEKGEDNNVLSEKGRIILNEFINYNGLDLYTSSFNNFMKVKEGTNLITLCDKSEMAHYFYGGAFIKLLNKRYQITNVNLENAEISIHPTESFSMTFPCTDIEKLIENTDIQQLKAYTYQEQLKVTLNSGVVSFKIGRAKNSQFLSVDRIDIFNVTPNILLEENIIFLKFSGFINEYIAHTFAHLFLIALQTRFLIGEREFPKFFIKENSIYFYSSSSFGGGIFDVFLDMNILRDILERMWTIVIECPCQNGCSGCLYILECPDMDCPQNKKLDKSSIIEFLGNVLNKTQEASKYITRKFQGISDMDTLQEIKNKSINILKRKAEMSIKTVCNHRFFTDDDINQHPGWAGYCDYTNKIVAVLQGFPEADLLEIVAHEYTHNWQKEDNLNQVLKHFNAYDIDDKSNILFGGKLFSEGQAMYGAMKVLDYFGLNEKIIAIIRGARASSDEYSEGAKLMWYLEGKYGLVNLLNILKTGKMIDGTDITPDILEDWYMNSGVYNGIVQAGTEIINNGGLICMTTNYLNKQTEDLNRLSYHLTAILECSLENKKNTIGKFITDEKNKEKIWNVLREAINEAIGCYPTGNEIPCSKCKQKDYETLENVCILFKSKKYFDRIVNELHLDNF
ncbi:MAG: Zn-binding domain-containing protein, partial [candidate division WOR-3 bacterium]